MIETIMQFDGKAMIPASVEDLEALQKEYKKNQFVTGRHTTIGKALQPSIEQGNLLHACFQLVSENTENKMLQTKEAVKSACKIGIDFRDPSMVVIRPDGGVQFFYRSFSHKSLKGQERLSVIDKAFEWCASQICCSVEEMVLEAKSRMRKHR